MAFIQRIQPAGDERCADHDPGGCIVIDCVTTGPVTHHETGDVIHEAGAVVWHSHMTSEIHPEHRLNPDHPAEDHRDGEPVPAEVSPWCGECRAHPEAPPAPAAHPAVAASAGAQAEPDEADEVTPPDGEREPSVP